MLKVTNSKKVAVISTYPPRKCGIAAFTQNLVENLKNAGGSTFQPTIFAMQDENIKGQITSVQHAVRRDVLSDYMAACDYINSEGFDSVLLQHEFGLFGGEAGNYISLLLRRLKIPVFTTLHTVLENPEDHYFKALVDVCDSSKKVIVMNKRGINMLTDIYNITPSKIELIPHGIPDIPFNHNKHYKKKLGFTNRKVILTFGLLGPNKGIEVMLKALPGIVRSCSDIVYVVLGTTHPGEIKHQGYKYKDKLLKIIEDLHLQNNVVFHDKFVTEALLCEYLAAADVYVTPYPNLQQLTSGTLAFAVGAGKAVVSTPYWAAQELLSDGRGVLIPFGDSKALSKEIKILFENPSILNQTQTRAYLYGRKILWNEIGKIYYRLLERQLSYITALPQKIHGNQGFYLNYNYG